MVDSQELVLLPLEEIYEEVDGVWNLSNEQGQLGKLFVTNVRFVWFASSNELFNISVSYYQIKDVIEKDTKFGKTLVVKTAKHSGGYTLGFRIDPPERCTQVVQRLHGLLTVYAAAPIFGVDFEAEAAPVPLHERTVEVEDDDLEIIDEDGAGDAFAVYFADVTKAEGVERPPVYSESLGLAIEELRPGVTVDALWAIP